VANLLEQHGARSSNKEPKFVPLFIDRAFSGLVTQRAALHDPSDLSTLKYFGGRPDSLWMGSNVELTNRLTLQRRPGLSPFSTAIYPSAPDRAFSFELINGTIRVIIDTGATDFLENLTLTQVTKSSGGEAVYLGVFPDGANNAYVEMSITISGFLTPLNNGTFTVIASSTTSITVTNAQATPEIDPATAVLTRTLSITQVAQSSGGDAVYIGTFPCGGNNAYVGMIFTVSGFLTPANNGVFTCIASTTTTLTLTNGLATPEIDPASAVSAGAVYYDQQNGSKTLLFGKAPGAGQTYFVAVAGVLYMGDGVDIRKYTPLDTNGTIWNWGIVAPANQPNVIVTESALTAQAWVASTWFSTMGIIIDSNGNAEQLTSVNNDTSNPNTTQFGMSGSGAPFWAGTGIGGTILDGTVTWTNKGPIGQWKANASFNGVVSGGSLNDPASIFDQASNGFYENSRSGTGLSTGSVQPNFTGSHDQHFDGSCNWVWYANTITTPKIFTWQKNHVYSNFFVNFDQNSCIVEPYKPNPGLPDTVAPFTAGKITYLWTSGGGTSQATAYTPPWPANSPGNMGLPTNDGQLLWTNLGSATWTPNTPYNGWTASNSPTFNAVTDGPGGTGNLYVCTTTGTSGASAPWLLWQPVHLYAVAFTILDSNGYKQTVTVGGTSGATHPVWNTTVGGQTTGDGGVTWTNQGFGYNFNVVDTPPGTPAPVGAAIWTCVGTAAGATWTAGQSYYLPTIGFSPPSISDPFGGAAVQDTNVPVDTEFTINTGVSQTPGPPTWNATTGGYTTDNTVLWINNGAFTSVGFTWTKSLAYAYSFKARSLTDFYSVNVPGTTKPPVPPGLLNQITSRPLPAPTGSETGVVSTASPANTSITSGNAGATVTVSGLGSTDPQVDTIIIWRSTDGGGPTNMFELTEIPNPPLTATGAAGTWTFQDFLPQLANNLYPGLNSLISAPINHVNDPPASNFLPMVYNFQRIWGAEGQQVNFSEGPDIQVGNPNEAFNPSDELPFLANVIRIVKNTQGLVVFLTNSIEIIAGGPLTASFFSVTLCPSVGLLSYNALDVHAGEIYFFSADNQFYAISPSLSLSRSGFPLGDQFANLPSSGISDTIWNASNVYVAVHQNGVDNGIYIADGSTGWYRVNPYQTPGGYQGPEPVWSPYANITNGCKMVQSVETAPGIKKLLVGPATGCNEILCRDLRVFTDNGVQYDAQFTIGSIMLVHPGQLAVLKFLEMDFSGKQFNPKISFLLNEIAGTFTPFLSLPVADPPSLYGTTIIPNSYTPARYYFSSTKSLARARHMQIRVDFGVTANPDELYNLTIYGRLMQEF
jgi:hypothetical protein